MKQKPASDSAQRRERAGSERIKSKEEEEPTFIAQESLTCPILSKIVHAFTYAKASCYCEKDGDLMPGSKVIKGLHDAAIHIGWQEQDMVLIVAIKSPKVEAVAEFMSSVYDKRRMPTFLENVAPDAEVHADFLDILDSFQRREDGTEVLAETVKELTGGRTPRRILLTGFCVGGSLATIAACWAALQSPTSDVRCITFGSPNVGNAAFAEVFRWVVGNSYRMSFSRDPMIQKGGGLLGSFVPVRGTIYLTDDAEMVADHWVAPWSKDMKDHCIKRYCAALKASMGKTVKLEEDRSKVNPPCSDECKLQTGPAPPEPSRSGSTTEKHAAPTISQAKTAGEQHSAHLRQQSACTAPTSAPDSVSGQDPPPKAAEPASSAANGDTSGPNAGSAESAAAVGNAADTSWQHDHLFRPPGGAVAWGPGGERQPRAEASEEDGNKQQLPGLDQACTRCNELGACEASTKKEDETEEERQERLQSAAAGLFRSVVQEATGNQDIGVAEPPRWLTRAFSLLERDDLSVDLRHLHTLQKVLTIGKISAAVVLAGAAYQDEAGYARMTGLPPDKTRLIDDSDGADTQVHVSWIDSGTAVFAFRGTESTKDGLQDLKFVRRNIDYLQRAYPGAKAHTGFMQQFAAVVDESRPGMHLGKVLAELSGGRKPNRVLCTGHSLGGALATLGAAWAAIEYPNADIRCVTFGSPRVANRKFKRAFHALVGTSLRLTYGGDPVPSIPPNFRYDHVGCSIHVKHTGLTLKARPWHAAWRPVVGHHFLNKYTAGVYSLLPGGLEALPRFDDSDFKLPAEAKTSISCFGVTRTLETESDDSDSDSPRHHRANGETPAHADLNGKRSVKRSASEGSGGIFRHFRRSSSGSHKSTDHNTAASDAPNGGLEQIPEGKPVAEDAPHAGVEDKPKREPLLARLSHSLMRRGSHDKATAHEAASPMPSVLPQAVAAH
ncbi:probable lipase at C-terminar half [Coccomyxa sp. Obi]|nr:probable lipase at C-terminar half [Coccomyxa sp. Obi]